MISITNENSGQAVSDHFAEVSDMVKIGSGAERKIDDYKLSRYACYLIAQNGDPTKPEIALAQNIFSQGARKTSKPCGIMSFLPS